MIGVGSQAEVLVLLSAAAVNLLNRKQMPEAVAGLGMGPQRELSSQLWADSHTDWSVQAATPSMAYQNAAWLLCSPYRNMQLPASPRRPWKDKNWIEPFGQSQGTWLFHMKGPWKEAGQKERTTGVSPFEAFQDRYRVPQNVLPERCSYKMCYLLRALRYF